MPTRRSRQRAQALAACARHSARLRPASCPGALRRNKTLDPSPGLPLREQVRYDPTPTRLSAAFDENMNTGFPTLIHERVAQCREGKNPKSICRLSSGWVVIGDVQFLRGYCLLLSDPVVKDLNSLSEEERKSFLYEMSVLGDILLHITGARLINYEILGNAEHALHAHLFPRYEDEPKEVKNRPAWFYDKSYRASVEFDINRDKALMEEVRNELNKRNMIIEQSACHNAGKPAS